MPADREERDESVELMARVASLYYLDHLTQAEIAARIGLSRVKVVRLLKRARATGIVEIRIQTPPALQTALETALVKRFGLQQALLAADQPSEDMQRQLVAHMAASHLDRQIREGAVVAIGMGRNVGAVPDAALKVVPRRCTFVTAIGGSPQVGQPVNAADICRRLAERFGGSSECLYAPAYVANSHLRESFLCHEEVRGTLERARTAQIALVGIGDAMPDSAVVQMGCFSAEDMTRLREAGAVGDILGTFFDIAGRPVGPGMSDRAISLKGDALRRIPCVIGIAAESEKTTALLGALRTGILDVLVTSVGNARRLLEMDDPDFHEVQ
jgi:DNA-binding transcriptional regulator LsrR (DeoR family)